MPILHGTIVRESDKAILFEYTILEYPNGNKEKCEGKEWFPDSQITKIERHTNIGEDKIWISEWIAERKGLYDSID